MYVLDISEDVAGLHASCPPPTRTGHGPGECFSQLVDRCVSHALSVVAPYKREEDRIQEWFQLMYAGSPWETAEWYLAMEAGVLQPMLCKISQFMFSIIQKHPNRILEVETSRYEGRVGQNMYIQVQAKIEYSEDEVVPEYDLPTLDTPNDFSAANRAALEAIQYFSDQGSLMLSPIKLNPTLYSVSEPIAPPVPTGHWSDEPPEEEAARQQMAQYRETLGWVKDRLNQRVKEDANSGFRGMYQSWVKSTNQ